MRRERFGNRVIQYIGEKDLNNGLKVGIPFAALLFAGSSDDIPFALDFARPAISMGCRELCCIGDMSEELHDRIDDILLENSDNNSTSDVVTTWHGHEPIEDAIWYFLHIAGEKPDILVVLNQQPANVLELIAQSITQT